ncbi:MAG: PAS domain S-box protein, partial [Anaerolineales bacterium]|nr:PAS domain S-box protein [Anaerolineales bacterium]
MEDRPGLEVLRLIKEHSPYTECIILTGYASQEAAIEAVNAGAFSFLQKPYQIQQLLVTLQRALEKRATARALAESEARYRTFLDAMQDLAFLKDENFRYLFCNQANAKFFGRPLEEIIGRDDFALMDAQAAEGCRRSDRRVLEENRPITTVEIVGERVYETYKFPVPLGNGRTGVGGYVRDMTERLQTEHQMRLQSAALEASANAIVITNREGIIQWANPAFTALTGYKVPDEAFGRNPRDLVKSGKQDQRFYKNLWDTILSGRVWHGTLINRRKDGTLYDEEMTITPVKDASGQITHFIAVKQDISERKRAERALLESERRYAALVEAAPAGIFRTDARGLTTYVSPRWCELSGLDAQAALGNGWLQAIHPDDRERVMEGWLKAYQAGLPSTAEYRFLLPDGTIRWVRGQATPETDSEGRLTGYVGVILDITNLKQAEEALRASEARYRGLFENSPVSLWEEDFSEVKKRLDALRQEGIQDFATYLDAHPDFVRECAALARIRDVNRATLRLYCAANKQDLIANLATVFGEESYQDYRTELLYIAEGKTHFVWEGVNYTLDGQRLDVILHWEVIPGYEHDLSRVLVSIIDVTERKRAEAEIRHYLADLEMLYQSSINFNRLLDPREIGQTLVEILASHLEWHHITIRLRQEQSERLELIAFKYKDKELTQKEQVAPHLSRQISTIDQGLSGKAVREGKSILATDVHRFPEYLETFPSIRSGLYVPLIIEGRVIGVISIESEQADAFSQEDVRLLETLAAHAASAFHSAHLYQATLRAAQRREVLYRLSQEITQNFGNRDRVYEAIYQAVRQIMPADNFTIAIHDEATGEFIGEYLIDEGKRWPPVRASIQEGISGYVIRSGRPLRIGDALQESNAPTP